MKDRKEHSISNSKIPFLIVKKSEFSLKIGVEAEKTSRSYGMELVLHFV